jgi:CheY-like chemotaxis protein
MSKISVYYVDEEESNRNRFERSFESMFKIATFHPDKDIEYMVEQLLKNPPDCVVVDYNLMEYDQHIPYYGTDLTKAIHAHKAGFPCIVLTSFVKDAIDGSENANFVYSKDRMAKDEEKLELKLKLEKESSRYKAFCESNEKELLMLIDKGNKVGLNAEEEERIVELDNLVNQSCSAQIDVPRHLKEFKHIEKLDQLIQATENLIKKIKN